MIVELKINLLIHLSGSGAYAPAANFNNCLAKLLLYCGVSSVNNRFSFISFSDIKTTKENLLIITINKKIRILLKDIYRQKIINIKILSNLNQKNNNFFSLNFTLYSKTFKGFDFEQTSFVLHDFRTI